MINKRLKQLTYPILDKAIMYDWRIALVVSIYTGIHHDNVPSILYRQLGKNTIGANRYSLHYLLTRFGKVNELITRIIIQGGTLEYQEWTSTK